MNHFDDIKARLLKELEDLRSEGNYFDREEDFVGHRNAAEAATTIDDVARCYQALAWDIESFLGRMNDSLKVIDTQENRPIWRDEPEAGKLMRALYDMGWTEDHDWDT